MRNEGQTENLTLTLTQAARQTTAAISFLRVTELIQPKQPKVRHLITSFVSVLQGGPPSFPGVRGVRVVLGPSSPCGCFLYKHVNYTINMFEFNLI